jgi:sugar O-acyltransferase (sialic acid O-acetyltransferase NeuD family)
VHCHFQLNAEIPRTSRDDALDAGYCAKESMKPLVIFGAGGHARETAQLVADCNADRAVWNVLGYLTDDADLWGTTAGELPVLGGLPWLREHSRQVAIALGIGNPSVKRAVVKRIEDDAAEFPVLRHPTAIVGARADVGAGTLIAAACVLTVDLWIGRYVTLNRASHVAHDCSVADFATVAPGTMLSGNVRIGEGADLGTGVSFVHGVRVGSWSIIGAGAVVTHDIEDDVTAVGVPASVVKRRPSGWHLSA